MEKIKIEYEEVVPCGELKSDPKNGFFEVSRPIDATEAHERHCNRDPGGAIVETACGSGHLQCRHYNNCPLKNKVDDVIFEKLAENMVVAIEIRFCGSYQPKVSSGFYNR